MKIIENYTITIKNPQTELEASLFGSINIIAQGENKLYALGVFSDSMTSYPVIETIPSDSKSGDELSNDVINTFNTTQNTNPIEFSRFNKSLSRVISEGSEEMDTTPLPSNTSPVREPTIIKNIVLRAEREGFLSNLDFPQLKVE